MTNAPVLTETWNYHAERHRINNLVEEGWLRPGTAQGTDGVTTKCLLSYPSIFGKLAVVANIPILGCLPHSVENQSHHADSEGWKEPYEGRELEAHHNLFSSGAAIQWSP